MYDEADKKTIPKQADPREDGVRFFSEYVNAKVDYDEACREFQRALTQKERAAKKLAEINQRVQDIAARALNDPTEPQPNAPISGSSGLGQYGR